MLRARRSGAPAVGELAAVQRGLVAAEQLREASVTREAIRALTAAGVVHLVLPRVWAVGTPELAPSAAELAVLLHLSHDAVISHRSAAALWGLAPPAADVVQATLIGRGLRPRAGVELHRVAQLDSRDVRIRHGLPVTAPARTLLDHAATATATAVELEEAVAAARAGKLVTDAELEAAMARVSLRTGGGALADLLRRPEGSGVTRSQLERRLLALIRDAGLPAPRTNVVINGHEVDFVWEAQRLIVETDGWGVHGGRRAFERDRAPRSAPCRLGLARDSRHLATARGAAAGGHRPARPGPERPGGA